MEYNGIPKDKKINIGIQILRMILSFWIVTIHSYFFKNKYSLKRHFKQKMFHVPTFMLISFFFFYHHLSKRDSHKIKRRFKRLLIPYFTWSFVYLLINNAILKVFGIKNFKRLISFKDFFFQILLCNIYYANFWYINVLLFLSLLFSIIAYIAKNNFLFFIQLFINIQYF
jgi:fucose 4-O-acetylase-like acetyltransferase